MLRGKKIIVTSGPTRAPLDAFRYLTNRSTGLFGTRVAEQILRQGGSVDFIFGKGSLQPSPAPRLRLFPVETNGEVADLLRGRLKNGGYDAVIHAMALLDFRPHRVIEGKRSSRKNWMVWLIPAAKIIHSIKKWAPQTVLVGFKLELGLPQARLLARARKLQKKCRAELLVANTLTEGKDMTHLGYILDRQGRLLSKTRGKEALAKKLIAELSGLLLKPGLHPQG